MDAAKLRKMTVLQLREEAKKIPDVTGVSGMKKDELVSLVAGHLGIDLEAEATAGAPRKGKAPAAVDKSEIKRQIRALKEQKREALSAQDRKKAKACNRQIHDYKRLLRKMAHPGG